MAEIANTILISAIAFFVFLAVFLFINPDAGSTPPATGDMPVNIQEVEVHWGRATEQGTEVPVRLGLHNGGDVPARVVSVDYSATVDGRTVHRNDEKRDVELAPDGKADTGFTVRLGDDFPRQWWETHVQRGEQSSARIEGHVNVRLGDETYALPFEWASAWEGSLAQSLGSASNCADKAQVVCLDDASFAWDEGGLSGEFTIRNRGFEPYELEDGKVLVQFGEHVVAEGDLQRADLPTVASASTGADLRTDGGALEAWWPGHVTRCESTPATLVVQFTIDGEGPEQHITWKFPIQYKTHLVCGRA